MYIVKNVGLYPIIIRDLNLHISGEKTVDLDTLFNPDTVRRSVDLKNLIDRKKVELIEKETKKIVKPNSHNVLNQLPTQNDSKMLIELQKSISEIKDLLKSGSHMPISKTVELKEYDEETRKLITNLQVEHLSGGISDSKKNFENIGKLTVKSEKLDDLLDVLDDMEKKGD